MKLYLKRQLYQERQPEAVSATPGTVSAPGVRLYLKSGTDVNVPKSFPSVPERMITPASAPSVTPSVKIPAAQTFSLGHTLTSGRVVPSSAAYNAVRDVSAPSVSETAKAAHELTGGVNRKALLDVPAAVGNYATAVRNTSAARGIRQALQAEQSGKTDNARYGQYLSLMTPEEREKATRLEIEGGLPEEERGAYVRSLNLDERIRERNSAEQARIAASLEANTAKAKASKNAAGERYAKWAAGKDVISGRGEVAPVPGEFRVLTPKQKETFKAYADAGDFEAVANYYNALEASLSAKYAESQKKAFQGLTENNTAAAVASVPISGALNAFGGIPGYLATAGHVLKDAATGNYTPIDKNSEWYQIPRVTQAMDEGRNKRIDDKIENPTVRFIAKAASSGVSSGLSNLIQLATGTAFGLEGNALAKFVTAAMSASAGGQAAYRNLEEGQTNGDAFLNATASAAIEYWTEHMTTSRWIENLGKIKSGKFSKADIAKMIGTQTGAEMWEEVVGNVADQTWDRTWNGENSEFAKRTHDLMSAAGLSREDAETRAFKELYVDQSVEAALSVAFSMILMDGVPAISNRVSFAETGQTLRKSGGAETVDNEIEKGLLFPDSPAYKQAVKVRDKWDGGKGRVNDRELGRLSFLNAQEEMELVSDLGDNGTASQYFVRSMLEATRNNPMDKLSADSIRMLQNIREAVSRTPEEQRLQNRQYRDFRRDFLRQVENIDLDAAGNPLASYTEAVREIRAKLPNASAEQIRQIYSQYRDDTRTVLFGGHRLTRTQFRSIMQEATPEKLSKVNLDQLFNQAILDTLDGSDAYDRYLPGVTERNFSLNENSTPLKSAENAPQSATIANADADNVSLEAPIDGSVATTAENAEEDDLPFTWSDEQAQAAEPAGEAESAPLTPGLVRDEYTENALSPTEFARIDTTARLLGVSVRFVDSIQAGSGEANGLYRNGAVLVERDNKNPSLKILGHEWTHHIQKNAPEAYQRFMNSIADEIKDSAEVIREQYEKAGVTLTEAESMDEAAANYAGRLMTDGTLADEFIDRHIRDRSVLEKVRDAIADTLERMRRSIVNLGKRIRAAAKSEDALQAYREARQQEQRARKVLDRFNAALDAAAQNVREDAAQTDSAAQDNGDIRFAIKTTDSGEKYVRADRQVIFGNNPRSWGEQVENYINGKIRRGQDVQLITDDGDVLLLTKDTAGKASFAYKPGGVRMSDSEYETKLNAEAHIDELAQISKRGATRSDTGALHGDFASRGWNYRTAYFQDFDGKYYRLKISVAQGRNGDVVYNIGDIRERSFPTARKASSGSSADSGAQSGKTSIDNISQSAAESKENFSLKGTEDAEDIAALRRQVKYLTERAEELQRQRDYWQKQTRRSDPLTVEIPLIEAERVAKQIIRDYYSDIDPKELSAALKEASELMIRTDESGATTRDIHSKLQYAQDKLVPLVEEMLESAWARDTDADVEEWTDIKSRLHNTRLTISQSDAHDIPDYGAWRQSNMGRLNIGVDRANSTPVDVFYHEMSELYPSYFPADITAASDQLLHMAGLWEDFAPVYDNPFQQYLNDMDFKLYVVNDMLTRMVELEERAVRPTWADRQAEAVRQTQEQARERVNRMRNEKNAAIEKQRQEMQAQHQESMSKLRQEKTEVMQKQRRDQQERYERLRQEKNDEIERARQEGIRRARQAVEEGRRQRQEAVDRLKAQYKEKALNWALRKFDSAERQRLLKVAQRLSKMKADAVTRATIDSIIGNLDTVAVSLTGQSLDELVKLRRFYQDKSDKNSPRYDPDFIPDAATKNRLERLERRQISDLTLDEVRDLTNVLLNLEHELRTNKSLLSRDERIGIYQAGNQTIRDIEASEGVKGDFLSQQIDRKFITQTLSPIREIRRMVGYRDDNPLLKRAYALDDGQRVMLDYRMRAEAPFRKFAEDKAFRRRFSGKDAETIEITATRKTGERDGRSVYEDVTVKITPAMRVAIFCLSQDNDGLRHMRDGGLTIPDITLYRKGNLEEAYNQGMTVKLTPSQARKAVSGMTVQDRHFANLIHAYYNGQSRNEINRTSEILKGYSIAGNENYYPIHVDSNFLSVNFETTSFQVFETK